MKFNRTATGFGNAKILAMFDEMETEADLCEYLLSAKQEEEDIHLSSRRWHHALRYPPFNDTGRKLVAVIRKIPMLTVGHWCAEKEEWEFAVDIGLGTPALWSELPAKFPARILELDHRDIVRVKKYNIVLPSDDDWNDWTEDKIF